MTHKMVSIGAVDLRVTDVGTGQPLLLVHGFPLDHSMWRGQIAALARGNRVIAPDLRGFGGSSITDGTVTMERMADDLVGLLDALDVREPVVYCGLSMGGYVAWQFWRRHADRLRALILCDTLATADTPEAAQNRLKLADRVLKEGAAVVAEAMHPKLYAPQSYEAQSAAAAAIRQVMLDTDPRGIAAALRGMAERPDVQSWLPEIKVPTLVIVGEHDQISSPEKMRPIADTIPGAEWVLVPGAGHMSPLEKPEIVNEAIASFLARV